MFKNVCIFYLSGWVSFTWVGSFVSPTCSRKRKWESIFVICGHGKRRNDNIQKCSPSQTTSLTNHLPHNLKKESFLCPLLFVYSVGFFFHFFFHFFRLFCFFHMTQLHQHGILKTDDLITRFFRISTELCVEATYRALIDHVSLHKGGRRYTVCSYQYAMVFSQRFFQSNCNRKYMT